jgi:predicted nuclease with TOPRIM domain
MKVQTQNRLAHYQCELTEVMEQTQMLNSQLPAMRQQLSQYEAYLRVNAGDRKARADYSKLMQRFKSMCSQINRNQMRIQTLNRQIAMENNKICYQQQRTMMSAQKVRGRSRYSRYTY